MLTGTAGRTWAATVLARDGIAPTATSIAALQMWAKSEGNLTGRGFNWLNMTVTAPGATSMNSVGVKNYPSYTVGISTLASTLKGSYYSAILRAMSTAGTSSKITRVALAKIYSAINASPWCKGCQNGHYPEVMFTYLTGTGKALGLPTLGGTSKTTGGTSKTTDPCVWKFGPWCVLNESQKKAATGGLLVVAGGVLMLVGVALVGAYGLGSAALKKQVGKVAGVAGAALPAQRAERARRAQGSEHRQRMATTPEYRGAFQAQTAQARTRTTGAHQRMEKSRTTPFTDADRTPEVERRFRERSGPARRDDRARRTPERRPRARAA